jgi:hypothetical protein
MRFSGMVWVVACILFILPCCSSVEPPPVVTNQVPVSKVSGTLTVKGKPEAGVVVICKPIGTIAETRQQFLSGMTASTDADGKFQFSTYEAGDGLPMGEYALLFKWMPTSDEEMARDGERDKLDGKYDKPDRPFTKIKVEEGKPLDLGTIAL